MHRCDHRRAYHEPRHGAALPRASTMHRGDWSTLRRSGLLAPAVVRILRSVGVISLSARPAVGASRIPMELRRTQATCVPMPALDQLCLPHGFEVVVDRVDAATISRRTSANAAAWLAARRLRRTVAPVTGAATLCVGRRLAQIVFEHLGHLGGKLRIVHTQSRFLVECEGSQVKVGRAHRHHASVEDQRLALQHGPFVFANRDAVLKQRSHSGFEATRIASESRCLSGTRIRTRMPRVTAATSVWTSNASGRKHEASRSNECLA